MRSEMQLSLTKDFLRLEFFGSGKERQLHQKPNLETASDVLWSWALKALKEELERKTTTRGTMLSARSMGFRAGATDLDISRANISYTLHPIPCIKY